MSRNTTDKVLRPETNEEEDDSKRTQKEPIMSRAARRKAKKQPVVVTAEMREEAKERRRELRKYLRMLKSNGARRKVAQMRAEKRERETCEMDEACAHLDMDARPLKKGRRE
ncbi:uncharacterized protein TM35_000721030 [Trypanosoma theileri]|uniref:Uncharacterized protein n=1 Tax=Trypanosoma theileri TaxID=67003 RepID=A0A1X0NH49_9TRYP|nr:uncharacterized protein TM35_000721030 [Trypanosoma theileri]ORC83400.1 hypothetical protein TM35_000721030 [Trypanosoma theileri]